MAETTIQWTDYTFNPWVGCQRVSPGCEHCYAENYDKRVGGVPLKRRAAEAAKVGVEYTRAAAERGDPLLRWGPKAPRTRTSVSYWKQPLKWDAAAKAAGVRKRVFCASLADVFEDRAELIGWREDLFGLIASTPQLDWLLLTKRPENIARLWPHALGEPGGGGALPCPPAGPEHWPNVWLGTTVEDQRRADERIPALLSVPAAVRFLSCEPLLEHVNLDAAGAWGIDGVTVERIDWVIVGGESGGNARPFDVAWARELVDGVRLAGAVPFMKQLGARVYDSERRIGTFAPHDRRTPKKPDGAGGEMCMGNLVLLRDSHGGDPSEWPADLRVREFPEVRR